MNNNIGTELTCNGTGKNFIAAIVDGFTTNYATDSVGNYYSDEGVDVREKLELLDRTKSFYAYLSGDGRHVTGWKGNVLMTVTYSAPCKLSRMSFTHSNKTYKTIVAQDIHGGLWFGRGSAGVCITMRPYKI